MVRILGFLVGLGFVGALLWSFFWGAYAYVSEPPKPTVEHEFHLTPRKNVSWSFEGPFGVWDNAQLQRGYKVYKEICANCHSLRLVAFRDLQGIGYTEGQVKTLASETEVATIDEKTGDATTRKGKPSDYLPKPYANDFAARGGNNGALPPDLSLITKARHEGTHYVYSLLTGFRNQPAELLKEFPDAKTPNSLHYNPYFPNLNLAMAPPLTAEGQVSYDDGTKATVDQMAKDVSAFLTWTAEPKLMNRRASGWGVMIFLLFFTMLTWFAYQNVWREKEH